MRVILLSDMHFNFWRSWGNPPVPNDIDAVFAAGDLSKSSTSFPWLKARFGNDIPIFFVPGNHEFDVSDYHITLNRMREEAKHMNIIMLESPNHYELGDSYYVVGDTLWTDFNLYGNQNQSAAMNEAAKCISDYSQIFRGNRLLTPEDTLQFHNEAKENLLKNIANLTDRKIIVMSHHAPSPQSTAEKYIGDSLNPYFGSNILHEFEGKGITHWFHGHMHNTSDYVERGIRVICNPRGYRGENFYEDEEYSWKIIDLD